MIKVTPCLYNTYKPNFKADSKVKTDKNPPNSKKFGFVDAGILVAGTWAGAIGGFFRTQQIGKNIRKQIVDINNTKDDPIAFEQRMRILERFSWLVEREAEGKPSDVPNCVMITGKDEKYHNEMIQWIADHTPCRFKTMEYNENILAHLEAQEATFKVPGKDYLLLQVKNCDRLINPKTATFSCIESMKDIMSSTEIDYHTILIFGAEHPEELDSIALQPHRVRELKLDADRDAFFKIEELMNSMKQLKKELGNLSLSKKMGAGALIGLLVGAAAVCARKFLSSKKQGK